jgi:UDP-N-acetylglucosamine--N-acetylmuramyl-(pentapeptide) pyrophosphoryl-undecaprenol N-acetylglucosamine transferase
MEMEKVPEAGYKIVGLWISGLQRRITLQNLLFPVKLLSSILKTRKIIKQFKPHAVIGVGGYASGPMLRTATSLGVPTLIQEQNSYAGLTNKLLSAKVSRICVAYDNMEKYFPKEKIVFTGNPVRQDIIGISRKREEALKFFNLDKNKKTIFAMGGSLGARTINESIFNGLKDLQKEDIQIIWQIGKFYFDEFTERIKDHPKDNIRTFGFLREMDLAYAAADVVITRAGALSISELCLAEKPSIFVPSPNVSEDHQTKNANALTENKAALMVADKDAKEKLVDEAIKLLKDATLMEELKKNIKTMARPNAAESIVKEIIEIIK